MEKLNQDSEISHIQNIHLVQVWTKAYTQRAKELD